jgi:hypothetical protein
MMSVAEATNTNGTVLGGIVTFILYGILPTSIIIYIMDAPRRKRVRLAREHEASELAKSQNGNETQANTPKPSINPDPNL